MANNEFLKRLYGKDIIVLNTKTNPLSFDLAHLLRNYARTTFCIDPAYVIAEDTLRIRSIEEGRVYLLKGDFYKDKANLLKKIKKLKGKPEFLFDMEPL